jgi:hypothetical protein
MPSRILVVILYHVVAATDERRRPVVVVVFLCLFACWVNSEWIVSSCCGCLFLSPFLRENLNVFHAVAAAVVIVVVILVHHHAKNGHVAMVVAARRRPERPTVRIGRNGFTFLLVFVGITLFLLLLFKLPLSSFCDSRGLSTQHECRRDVNGGGDEPTQSGKDFHARGGHTRPDRFDYEIIPRHGQTNGRAQNKGNIGDTQTPLQYFRIAITAAIEPNQYGNGIESP